MKILDIGCGKGENCFYLLKRYPNSNVYGIDISSKNIKEAKKYFQEVAFKVSRAEDLPFRSSFFDKVYCYEVLEHVYDLKKTMDEIKRVLKPEGIFILSVPSEKSEKKLLNKNPNYWKQIGHKRFFSKDKISKLVGNYGFKIIKYKKYNSVEHLYWLFLFHKKYKILTQNSKLNKKEPLFFKIIKELLNQDNFKVYRYSQDIKNKIIYIIKIFFLPISFLLDIFFINKKQTLICIKISKSP